LGTIRHLIEWTSVGIEVLAIAVIVVAIVSLALTRGTVRYLLQRSTSSTPADGENKPSLSKPLLMALELFVAGEVLRTVVLEPTLYNVVALALLILVRTFLSWSMRVEIDGRWPWQSKVSVRDQEPENGRDRIFYNP